MKSTILQEIFSRMNRSLDWNDYAIVLAIADAGSMAAAARQSGSSHPTLFRKLNAIEERLGVRLFERLRSGYVPTSAGEEMVAVAREMAELAANMERRLSGQDLRPSGLIRVTTTDTLLFGLLGVEFAQFRIAAPEISLEIIISNDVFDLSRREADIAIRPASAPEPHLVGRKLGVIRQAVYGHRALDLSQCAKDQPAALPWIGPSRSMIYDQLHAWMTRTGYDEFCCCRIDTLLGIYAAVRSGGGVAVLPAYLGEADSTLEKLGNFIDDLDVDVWLLIHPDLQQTARIRCLLDFLVQSRSIRRLLRD